jgi:hypothetical protein
MVTRITTAEQLKASNLYWNGPEWLLRPMSDWPEEGPVPTTGKTTPLRVHVTHVNKSDDETCRLEVSRWSNWSRLSRTVAWMLRWKHHVKCTTKIVGSLTADEVTTAELCIVRMVQKKEFKTELKLLEK